MERFQQSKTILDLVGDKAVAQEDKQRFLDSTKDPPAFVHYLTRNTK